MIPLGWLILEFMQINKFLCIIYKIVKVVFLKNGLWRYNFC